jgi:hypothetical protein
MVRGQRHKIVYLWDGFLAYFTIDDPRSHTFFQIQFIIRNLKIRAWISNIRDADTAAKISLKISGGSDTTTVTSVLPQAALMLTKLELSEITRGVSDTADSVMVSILKFYQRCMRHRWCDISIVALSLILLSGVSDTADTAQWCLGHCWYCSVVSHTLLILLSGVSDTADTA